MAAAADPELLRLERDAALLEARLLGLLEKAEADTLGSDALRRMRVQWAHFRELSLSDPTAALAGLGELGREIERAAGDRAVWEEVRDTLELRRRVVDSIRRQQVQQQEVLTMEQAMALFVALSEAVRQNVQDRETARRISEQFARLTNRPLGDGDIAPASGGGRVM
jgi:hypothetical protein